MDGRAQKLEYTHPYMISEIVTVVKNVKRKDMWILFKVFKWELWTMIIVTYFFVGFVVRILQHQSNGLLFWFPLAVLALPDSTYKYIFPSCMHACVSLQQPQKRNHQHLIVLLVICYVDR